MEQGDSVDNHVIVSILAAKSQQSSAIISHLLSLGSTFTDHYRIRAIVRDPITYSFPITSRKGNSTPSHEVIVGDMSNVKSLQKAFQGSDVVWTMTSTPPDGAEAEYQLGKNIVDAFLDDKSRAKRSRKRLLIFSSAVDAPSRTNGKIIMANALGKAMVEKYIHGLPSDVQDSFHFTFIHCGMFMQNFTTYQRPTIDNQGVYHFKAAVRPDVQIPYLDVSDLGPLIWQLIREAFPPSTSADSAQIYDFHDRAVIRAFGESLSFPQLVEKFTIATGVKAVYDYVTLDQFLADTFGTLQEDVRKQMKERDNGRANETIVTMIGDMYNLINQFGYYGGLHGPDSEDPLISKIIFQQSTIKTSWQQFVRVNFELNDRQPNNSPNASLKLPQSLLNNSSRSPAEEFLKAWASYFITGSGTRPFEKYAKLSVDFQETMLERYFAESAIVEFPYFPKGLRDTMKLRGVTEDENEDGAKLEGHSEIEKYFGGWRDTFWFEKGKIKSLNYLPFIDDVKGSRSGAIMEMRLEGKVASDKDKTYAQDYVSFAYVDDKGKVILYKEYWAASRF